VDGGTLVGLVDLGWKGWFVLPSPYPITSVTPTRAPVRAAVEIEQ
jgi:hypothetical protein